MTKSAAGHAASAASLPSLESSPAVNPERDCPLCPRLVALRLELRAKEPTWFNAPVPNFGPATARLGLVGLAPGLRGANRTGRPFTGDFAGLLLYETLLDFGLAKGTYRERIDDGLTLVDCRIINSVHCLPPENKPTPLEVRTCSQTYLRPALAEMPNLSCIVALGRIAHDCLLRICGTPLSSMPFRHGAQRRLTVAGSREIDLFDSYHCSRYNTNTGVLTREMFRSVFSDVRARLDASS